jgi:hypothetical protein
MILIPGLACPGDVWDGALAHWSSRYRMHVLTIAGLRRPIFHRAAALGHPSGAICCATWPSRASTARSWWGTAWGDSMAWWLAANRP